MYRMGRYEWEYVGPVFTSHGMQEKVLVTRGSSQPLLIVVSRPCDRSCETRESALVNTLCYISDIWAFEMNDLHFSDYVVRHHEVLGI
jgi:hypothetical protein